MLSWQGKFFIRKIHIQSFQRNQRYGTIDAYQSPVTISTQETCLSFHIGYFIHRQFRTAIYILNESRCLSDTFIIFPQSWLILIFIAQLIISTIVSFHIILHVRMVKIITSPAERFSIFTNIIHYTVCTRQPSIHIHTFGESGVQRYLIIKVFVHIDIIGTWREGQCTYSQQYGIKYSFHNS